MLLERLPRAQVNVNIQVIYIVADSCAARLQMKPPAVVRTPTSMHYLSETLSWLIACTMRAEVASALWREVGWALCIARSMYMTPGGAFLSGAAV